MNYFSLYHIHNGESIAIIMMDEETTQKFLDPQNNIIDKSTTFFTLTNGKNFTIIPIDNPSLSLLKQLEISYNNCVKNPSSSLSMAFGKYDNLTAIVGQFFETKSYYLINDISDIDKLINARNHNDEKPNLKENIVFNDIVDLISK